MTAAAAQPWPTPHKFIKKENIGAGKAMSVGELDGPLGIFRNVNARGALESV